MGDWWYRQEYKCQFIFNRRILFSFDRNVGGPLRPDRAWAKGRTPTHWHETSCDLSPLLSHRFSKGLLTR